MRGFATSGGVVVPSFDRAARTGHKVSGGGGGGGIGCAAFFRRFFTTAATKTLMAMSKSDVDGSNAHNVSSDAQVSSGGELGSEAIFAQRAATARQDVVGTNVLRLFNPSQLAQNVSGTYNAGDKSAACLLVSLQPLAHAGRSSSFCGLSGVKLWHWYFLVAHSTHAKRCC